MAIFEPNVNIIPHDWPRLRQSIVGLNMSAREMYRHLLGATSGSGPQEGSYREIIGQPFPTSVTWYTNSDRTAKVVSCEITRNQRKFPTQIVVQVYEPNGTTVAKKITDAISYDTTGVFESTRTRTIG